MSNLLQPPKPAPREPKRAATLMAPAFLSKLVKQSPTTSNGPSVNNNRTDRERDPSRLRKRTPSLPSSTSSEHSNPDVLVIPPSPATSASVRSRQASPRQEPRTLSVYVEPKTPTAADRPGISIRHSSSLTNIRSGQQAAAPAERHHATALSTRANGHARGVTDGALTTSPPAMTLTFEDGPSASLMSPIVESPAASSAEFKREGRSRAKSDGLCVPDGGGGGGDDARSIRSVSKGRSWMRSSSREPAAEPASGPSSPVRERRKEKRPTGLGAALAASGMAIANPTVSVQHVSGSLTTTPARQPRRSASISSIGGVSTAAASGGACGGGGRHDIAAAHAPRLSIDGPINPGPDRHERTKMSASSHGSAPNTDIESALGSDSEDELDLDDDIPVTGFAVASTRRNAEFHEMFPAVPEGDYLIEDYGCALARDILVQGRLYISENHLCFHANIFGWVTDLIIPMHDVLGLDKKMTALIIPNAVQVSTRDAKYTFASFMARDTTFDVIYNVWRLARPPGSVDPSAENLTTDGVEMSEERVGLAAGAAPGAVARKATQCACGQRGEHYTSSTPMDVVLPGTPEKIYNLMFASGFIKEFMRDNQKLTDIQISDWQPDPETKLLSRKFSYIKPLNGSIGPKSTKCELKDETVHFAIDDYISTVTTTRTPDVPSGSVFSVKTRTCITWASTVTSRVCVTSTVEWTGRSFIRSIIDKSAIDGQNTYHDALDKAMRAYIHENRAEFIPAGIEPDSLEASAEAQTPATEHPPPGVSGTPRERERERSQRGLQWAYDTFEGALKVARTSTEGALDLLADAWEQSSGATLLYFVIALLVLSNAWTLAAMGRREEAGRRKGLRAAEEREKLVHGVIAGLWEEIAAARGGAPVPLAINPRAEDWQSEVDTLTKGLDAIQERLTGLRQSLMDATSQAPSAS